MSYTTNPHLPKVRMQAVKMIRQGHSYRQVALHFGYSVGAIHRWVKKAKGMRYQRKIPTTSSRPKHHPRALSPDLVRAIIQQRLKHGRCAEVVHQELGRQGVKVSVSSVKRVIKRHGLLKERSPWKRPHDATERPQATQPGDLVQIDTIHVVSPQRLYVYTLLDVYSRWAYAAAAQHIRVSETLRFMHRVKQVAPFEIQLLQSDHGLEFSQGFTLGVGLKHRHSRVRRPNDNAHLERFNRTLQEECLDHVPVSMWHWQRALKSYLHYYNTERLHMGIDFHTPLERSQGID